MKKLVMAFVLLVLFSFLIQSSFAAEPAEYKEGSITLKVFSSIDVEYKIKGIGHVTTELNFIPPTTWRQGIETLTTDAPNAEIKNLGDKIIFEWSRPKEERLDFRMNADVYTRNDIIKIDGKVNYPIDQKDLSEYASEFVEPTKFIDSNSGALANKARELAEGETDLFIVTHKIAEWVRTNVKYDLNTLTADVVQPSSWVYQNRIGVCDEVTNLFIAMLRSLGIPAKFISGVVYTNTFDKFDAHGWAEVYFPKHGWVPFDIVFAQYGFLDPSHVELQASKDPSEPAVVHKWSGFDIEPGKVNIEADFKSLSKPADKLVNLNINILKNDVGFGSSVPIEISVENLQAFYLPITIIITKAPMSFSENVRSILLKPHEKKSVSWLIKIPTDLEKGYSYSSIIEVKDIFGQNASAELRYGDNPIITEEEAKAFFKPEETGKTFLKDIEFKCSLDKNKYNIGDFVNVHCTLKNSGNIKLEDIKVCFKDDCSFFDILRINEKRDINFGFKLKGPLSEGKDILVVRLENENILEYRYLNVNISLNWYEKVWMFFSNLWGAVF